MLSKLAKEKKTEHISISPTTGYSSWFNVWNSKKVDEDIVGEFIGIVNYWRYYTNRESGGSDCLNNGNFLFDWSLRSNYSQYR